MQIVLRTAIIGASLCCLVLFQGCATMDQSECQTANWEIIGLEDGSAGRLSSYIGEHRSACAEYRVSPDLDAYLRGHARGVSQYCTYDRGYSGALRGGQPNSNCGRSQHQQYHAGFTLGQDAYKFERQISNLEGQLQGMENRLSDIDQIVIENEALIVADETTPRVRRELLREVKELGYEKSDILQQMPDLESQLSFVQREYEQFRQQPR